MKRDGWTGSAKMDSEGKKEARLNFDYQSLFPVSNFVSFLIHFVIFYFVVFIINGKVSENWLILSSILIIDQITWIL